MPLTLNQLASELENVEPTDDESVAINRIATAWDSYFQAASVAGVPCAPGATSGAKESMIGAMSGLNAPGAAAATIAAGIAAYWAGITAATTAIWVVPGFVSAPATPPPTLGAIAPGLASVFVANTSGMLSLAEASQQVAVVLHTNGGVGAIVTLTPPPPAPPVPTVVL